jgi:hypothetical protein
MTGTTTDIIHCKNCGQPFTGNYCNNCGEKKHTENEKKIRHVFSEAFHFLTHLDNKFLKTIRLVLFKPGTVSFRYCAGIRKQYFKPIGLFLICVLLYLLFPAFKGLNPVLGTYASEQDKYYHLAKPIVDKKMHETKMSFTELANVYEQKSMKVSKFLLLLYIPFSAVILSILYYRRKKYFYDHFILATEINSFFIMVAYLLMPFIMFLLAKLNFFEKRITTNVLAILLGVIISIAIFSAFRKFYKEKIGWTILKSILFLAGYILVVIPVYNMIVFLTVMTFI